MQRLIALLIMVIPGIAGVVGIKLMRDVLFGIHYGFGVLWLQFAAGFILFVCGLSFVAGFVFYRDRKRNKVQTRFQKK
ncbi:DUF2627 domain-containing protein [Fictibacillus sp. WQ 8-8]|uniref:DUF2627 domain-containing protein n=1 Tax=Fictibacillus sp. WQ 8-8 TaxID=2938788 RepID=UPI00210CE88C|nr:DUF2627 domain-containing protein [Fictibacillus sp. WQ 8-8]MCQ6266153.1 DUF2627 domain-containing protein [Fictibacillus sp. WQ 8-8]